MGKFKEMLMEQSENELIQPFEENDLPIIAATNAARAETARHGVNVENVPDELKAAAVWLLWAKVPDEKAHSGFGKVPVNARTLGAAKSTDCKTWCDFETAVRSLGENYGREWHTNGKEKIGMISGLGFALDGLPDIFVIDIDNIGAGLASGDFEGADMVRALGSYTERSVSGNGLHIICKGKKPGKRCKKGHFEVYEGGRYMTFTGDKCFDFDTIKDCTESFKPYYEKYFGKDKKPAKKSATTGGAAIVKDDNEIITRCKNGSSGEKFSRLWNGDISDYNDDKSAADLALCNMLAKYTDDESRIDGLFRQSKLYREKWDEPHYSSGETYGQHTIRKALESRLNAVINPPAVHAAVGTYADTMSGEVEINYGTLDSGNCERFVHAVGDKVLYNKTREAWTFFTGSHWRRDERGGEIEFYKNTVGDIVRRECAAAVALIDKPEEQQKITKRYEKIFNTQPIKNALIQAASKLGRCNADFDREDRFAEMGIDCEINTPSGIAFFTKLRDGKYHCGVIPHKLTGGSETTTTAHLLLTKITSAGNFTDKVRKLYDLVMTFYSGSYSCPTWEKCIDDWTGGDKALARFLQKAAGYSLTTFTREKCYFYLYGAGDNGKSVFCKVLKDIIGDYCTTINAAALGTARNGGTINNDELADLDGKRLVFVHEQGNKRLDSETLKRLTGDGDTIKATRKYEHPVEFVPVCKLWITSNEPFTSSDTSKGGWSRPVIIKFAEIPESKRDKGLKDKLKAEYDDILMWALKGVEMYLNEGLERPESVQQAIEAARVDCDIIGQFLNERTESAAGAVLSSQELFKAWKVWTEERGEFTGTSTYFGRELKKRGLNKKQINGRTFYIGLSILDKTCI